MGRLQRPALPSEQQQACAEAFLDEVAERSTTVA